MTHPGIKVSGHFGEWLQGRLGPRGPVVLVTMACHKTGVVMSRHASGPDAGPRETTLCAQYPTDVMDRFVSVLGLRVSGHIRAVPCVAAGLGTGVSTASLIGLARLARWQGPPEELARACVLAEGASDPLMFSEPDRVLWGSRDGTIHAHLPALPRHEVIGGFWGGACPTDALDSDFPDISDLVAQWQGAHNLAKFAALAAESARRCIARRGPAQDPAAAMADTLGAVGWNMAHTGAARGFIFAPGTIPPQAADILRKAGYRDILQFEGGGK